MSEAYLCDHGDCEEIMKWDADNTVEIDGSEYHLCDTHVSRVVAFICHGCKVCNDSSEDGA